MKNKVCVLLSTYNGEEFIEDQLLSLIKQTYKEFDIIIRDDGSQDNTIKIIKKFICQNKYTNIYLLEENNIGIVKSFYKLLQITLEKNYEYFLFSDQDDIWKLNKIEKSLQETLKFPQNVPLLVHSDMQIIDKNNNLIANSFFKYTKLDPLKKTLNYLLMQNNITGNTVMINKQLAHLIRYNKNIIMHDWWLALVASSFGNIIFINEPLVKYRKHNNNVIGPKNIYSLINFKKLFNYSFDNIFSQAYAFKEIYYDKLNLQNKIILDNFLKLQNANFIEKKINILKYKFYKQNFTRTFVALWKI